MRQCEVPGEGAVERFECREVVLDGIKYFTGRDKSAIGCKGCCPIGGAG